jgi:hypothetical protein
VRVCRAYYSHSGQEKTNAMAHHHAAALRNGVAALLACALLLGCGGAGGAGGGSGGSGGLFGASRRDRFDGRYEGQRLPPDITASTSTCRGRARAVRFEVQNGIIEMRTSRSVAKARRAELWGAVSTDGQVAMRPASGKRTVVGRIEGDRLTATDTQEGQATAQTAAQGGRVPCLYRYEATRVGSSAARSASRDGGNAAATAAAAGPPPVEGFAQP